MENLASFDQVQEMESFLNSLDIKFKFRECESFGQNRLVMMAF